MGSEMCIRDRHTRDGCVQSPLAIRIPNDEGHATRNDTVSLVDRSQVRCRNIASRRCPTPAHLEGRVPKAFASGLSRSTTFRRTAARLRAGPQISARVRLRRKFPRPLAVSRGGTNSQRQSCLRSHSQTEVAEDLPRRSRWERRCSPPRLPQHRFTEIDTNRVSTRNVGCAVKKTSPATFDLPTLNVYFSKGSMDTAHVFDRPFVRRPHG